MPKQVPRFIRAKREDKPRNERRVPVTRNITGKQVHPERGKQEREHYYGVVDRGKA